jgi:hypothetical protein
MLYKRKQVYWIDGYIDGKRIKMCTELKDKARAQQLYLSLFQKTMITNRLGTTLPFNSKNKT